mmetsp:Transcript_19054/g.43257  ORF Transcript_19054/g.43257 Transcript_19054/m.43257 type:complete len:333 (+) Transcript_19054:374-1372(+)
MRPRMTSRKMPALIPRWMERGISMMVTKEGIATRRSFHAMPLLGSIMNAPVSTRGAAAARSGMAVSKGAMNAESAKRMATTMAVSPVRAPSMMPALLSFAMTKGLVPSNAPTIVPMAVLAMIPLLCGTPPCFSRPAMLYSPYFTPAMSKSATKSMTEVPTTILPVPRSQPTKSNEKSTSNRGAAKICLGGLARPEIQLPAAIVQMPMSRTPFVRPLTSRQDNMQKVPRARVTPTVEHWTLANVMSLPSMHCRLAMASCSATTKPIICRPIIAWKIPMATALAFLRWSVRIVRTIQSLTPSTARSRSRAPLTKQQLNASPQETLSVWQNPKVK